MGKKIQGDKAVIEPLTHEIATLKRDKLAKRSEQISPAQGSLLDDLLDTDLEAIEAELNALRPEPVLPLRFSYACRLGEPLRSVAESSPASLISTPVAFGSTQAAQKPIR